MKTAPHQDDYRGSWSSDVLCAAVLLGILFAFICCLPVIAPYGIADVFHSVPAHHARLTSNDGEQP